MLDPRITNEFESEILELIDSQDDYTRSDMQGIVSVLVNRMMQKGYEVLSEQEK
ncbi:MAG: hypothetical protein GW762_04010 [Candidatus Pacebacteria bacterium]|nr:hypothetical protein [Candidatus Paceibacterota bacterium]